MVLKVFQIEPQKSNKTFTDVKDGEWYCDVIATACEIGIVNGYPDGRFGIGEKVSRADMAVMVGRTLDIMKKDLPIKNAVYIFTDYLDIPDYAYNDVVKLQQFGLVQGDGYRNFNPANNLTRAESATVLWSVFREISGNIFN